MSEVDHDEKFYSQIIYRSRNDADLQEMLNRKGRSKSPHTLPAWSPEISYEHRIRKKKLREDDYVKKIYPEERPILLVKKKHVYKNLGNPMIIGTAPDEDQTYKLTKNTEVLEDIDEDLIENERNIRRFTMVHDQKKGRDPSPTNKSIFKVEGVEYLPEGFLELDPLLYKDEYKFDTRVLEDMFMEEQRRLKALRRKQYSEKNYLKRRDVTIYVIDQYKDKVVEFLDRWFEKYQRRMNNEELKEVANRLGTSLVNMRSLQDLYLQKKILMKSKQLREYFNRVFKQTIPIPNGTRVPEPVKRYLRKLKKYRNVKSKVSRDPLGNSRWRYYPQYLEKYNTAKNLYNRPYSATFKSTGILGSRSKSPYKNKLLHSGKQYGNTFNPKYRKTVDKLKRKPKKGDPNSESDTFYLLSKTGLNDPRGSGIASNMGKSVNGRLDRLMDEFSELLGKKDSEPIARFHRLNPGFSQTHGKLKDKMKFGNVGKSDSFVKGMRSRTPKKDPISSDPINEVPKEKKKGKKKKNNKNAVTPEKEYDILHKLPEMNTNDTDNIKALQGMNEDALKVYFDTEINHILDKIKGIKTDKPEEPYRDKLNPQEDEEIDAGDIDKLKEDMISAQGSDMQDQGENNSNLDGDQPGKISIVNYSESRGSLNSKMKDLEREGVTFPNIDNKEKDVFGVKVIPKRLDTNQEFMNQMPEGKVELTRQQRDKLIQVLRTHDSEEDDILLTLNREQTQEVVRQNLGKPEICVSVNDLEFQMAQANEGNVKLFPRDFYPLVEKNKLRNSEIRDIPKNDLRMVQRRPIMLRKPVSEARNKIERLYPKDMLELVEEEQEKGQLQGYPQEIFDLIQAIGETKGDPELIERAKEIFPEEMIEVLEDQAERHKHGENIMFPEDIFEISDQEKLNGERVSFFAKQLMDLVNKEGKENDKVLFPKRLMKTLQDKYNRVVHLDPEQREHAINMLSEKGTSQVVISPEARLTVLRTLTDHKEKETEALEDMLIDPEDPNMTLNDDLVGPCSVNLSADQVMDILNQNCLVEGIPITLNEDQMNKVTNGVPPNRVLQGAEYMEGNNNRLVDDKGDYLCLDDLSVPEKNALLEKLKGKRFHVGLSEPKKVPRVVEEVFYDPSIDGIVDTRSGDKQSLKDINTGGKLNNFKIMEKKNLRPMPSALPNQPYYDALVDELVDKDGERHNLKDLTLREVEDLVAENEAEEVPVIIQPDGRNILMLDNVQYLPIEDSLTDQKNRKTILTDLTPDERLSLMEALGDRKGIRMNDIRGSQDSRDNTKGMFGSRQQRELDQVMERMVNGDQMSPNTSWKQNYSKGASGSPKNTINKKTVKINDKRPYTGKKLKNIDKRSMKSGKSSKSGKSGKSGKSKKSKTSKKGKKGTKSKKDPNSSIETDYLNTVKSNKSKKKKPVESVVVANLRNSSKNPLLEKLMLDETESKKSKKKKGKKNKDKALSVKSSTTKKSKKNNKKESKFLSEPNNLVDKDPDEPNNEMNTFVEGGSLDEISYDADNSQNKSDPNILDNVIDEAREEDENDEDLNNDEILKEDIDPADVIGVEGSDYIDPDQTLGEGSGDSKNWAEYSDSRDKLEKYETFNHEEGNEENDPNEGEDNKTEKTVPKIAGNTFTNELLVQELESKHDNESPQREESMPDKEESQQNFESLKNEESHENLESRKNEESHENLESRKNEDSHENLESRKNEESHERDEPEEIGVDDNFNENSENPESFGGYSNEQIQPNILSKLVDDSIRQDHSEQPSSNERRLLISSSGKVANLNNSPLRRKIEKMFQEEKQKLGFEIMKKCESMIIKRSKQGEIVETEVSEDEEGLLDDFHLFCQEKLPSDPKYKESMMFVSLFYYYLERKGMLRKRRVRKKRN